MCNETMRNNPYTLRYVPDHLKTREMCIRAVKVDSWLLKHVPDHFKTQEMCIKGIGVDPWLLGHVSDRFKTQEMCNEAVKVDPCLLCDVPDWFVTQKQTDAWYDDDCWHHDDEIIEWYDGHKRRKAPKAKIKEDLLPIAWHLDRVMDWCMSEGEKRRWN